MDPNLKTALDAEDVEHTLTLAVSHADSTIRRYIWRGFWHTTSAQDNQACAADKTADAFVSDALVKFMDGVRAYDPERSLLENLNSATDSLISSYKKTSDRTPLVDYAVSQDEEGHPIDPISSSKDPGMDAADKVISANIRANQDQTFHQLRSFFDDEPDMQAYLDAMKEGFYVPRDIADVTNLAAEQVSELRRRAKNRAKLLFGVQNFAELKRKIEKVS